MNLYNSLFWLLFRVWNCELINKKKNNWIACCEASEKRLLRHLLLLLVGAWLYFQLSALTRYSKGYFRFWFDFCYGSFLSVKKYWERFQCDICNTKKLRILRKFGKNTLLCHCCPVIIYSQSILSSMSIMINKIRLSYR